MPSEWEEIFKDLARLLEEGNGEEVLEKTSIVLGAGAKNWFAKNWFSEHVSDEELAEAYALRGNAHILRGNPEAKMDLEGALRINPKNERALACLSSIQNRESVEIIRSREDDIYGPSRV